MVKANHALSNSALVSKVIFRVKVCCIVLVDDGIRPMLLVVSQLRLLLAMKTLIDCDC